MYTYDLWWGLRGFSYVVCRCDADYRRELASNVLMVGGSSLIDGLDKRLVRELQEVMPSHMKVGHCVYVDECYCYFSCIGMYCFAVLMEYTEMGRLLALISSFRFVALQVKMVSNLPEEKLNSAWIGGSVLSICGSFHQLWVSKQQYEEQGAARLRATKFVH